MVEVIITGGIVAAAAYVASRRPMSIAGVSGAGEIGGDLPCPWCRSDTSEQDTNCPGCGQTFG